MGQQKQREGDIGDQAPGEDGLVVHAEGERVAEVGDHREPGGPPGPPLPLPERYRQQDDEQEREREFAERVSAFQEADVAGQAGRGSPDVAEGCPGQLGEGAAVIGREVVAGDGGQIGTAPKR